MYRPITIAAAAVLPLLVVASAFAHAEPDTFSPGAESVVTSPPAEIVLGMTQDMARQTGANDIDVFAEDGTEVTVVAAAIDNSDRRTLRVPMPDDLDPGTYTVRWKTLSDEDGDPDSGEFTFTYDPAGPAVEGTVSLGRTTPVEPTATSAAPSGPTIGLGGDDGGMSWVLVAAVGAGTFVLGCGVTYVLVQKRP